jgi:SapC
VKYAIVSPERHGRKKWLRLQSYAFAAAAAVAPVVADELTRAALSMPLAFTEHAGRHTLVAVLSLVPERNLFVAPDGRWLGSHVPAWFRGYPFRLLAPKGTDRPVLSVDEESGLVVDGGSNGEQFFDPEGNLSPALKQVLEFWGAVERSHATTDLAVQALTQACVIRPWDIKVRAEEGQRAIAGLHQIDESAIRALSDDAFLKLRRASALPIAYAQLLSGGQLGVFEQLARVQKQLAPAPPRAMPESLDSLFLPGDDTIRFN